MCAWLCLPVLGVPRTREGLSGMALQLRSPGSGGKVSLSNSKYAEDPKSLGSHVFLENKEGSSSNGRSSDLLGDTE